MEEADEEKIINLVLEESMMCILTNRGRIFIQTPYIDEGGNYRWREIELPDFQKNLGKSPGEGTDNPVQ